MSGGATDGSPVSRSFRFEPRDISCLRIHSIRLQRFWTALAVVALAAGCSRSPTPVSDSRLQVFVGVPPLAYLVEQIGGEHVQVGVLVQAGQDPHTFEPTPPQILAISRAAVFFKIDMPFENVLLAKIAASNQRLRIVDATEGVSKLALETPCCISHEHEHAEAKGEPDPHVWLSPPLLKVLAKNVATALCQADPEHERDYRKNLAALDARLDRVHQRVAKMLAPYRGCSFYVYHPGFAYFADAYGLKQEVVEVGGRSPAIKQLRALIEKAQGEGARTIFVQPQSAQQSAQVVANAIGGRVVSINGLDKNVIADIEDIAGKLQTAFHEGSPSKLGHNGQ